MALGFSFLSDTTCTSLAVHKCHFLYDQYINLTAEGYPNITTETHREDADIQALYPKYDPQQTVAPHQTH